MRIGDEWIVDDIYWNIIEGIDHTECMIVFLTENFMCGRWMVGMTRIIVRESSAMYSES